MVVQKNEYSNMIYLAKLNGLITTKLYYALLITYTLKLLFSIYLYTTLLNCSFNEYMKINGFKPFVAN